MKLFDSHGEYLVKLHAIIAAKSRKEANEIASLLVTERLKASKRVVSSYVADVRHEDDEYES